MADSFLDLETRKSVHINLTRDTHAAVRIVAFQSHLSMQEIFEALACEIADDDPYMRNFIAELTRRKKLGNIRKISDSDAESIFKAIEGYNPLSSDRKKEQ